MPIRSYLIAKQQAAEEVVRTQPKKLKHHGRTHCYIRIWQKCGDTHSNTAVQRPSEESQIQGNNKVWNTAAYRQGTCVWNSRQFKYLLRSSQWQICRKSKNKKQAAYAGCQSTADRRNQNFGRAIVPFAAAQYTVDYGTILLFNTIIRRKWKGRQNGKHIVAKYTTKGYCIEVEIQNADVSVFPINKRVVYDGL